MITNFKTFESYNKMIKEYILQYPISRSGKVGGEGTHVMCLPSDEYPKKYWNKIIFVSVDTQGKYQLRDMTGSNKERLTTFGGYYSLFFGSAIPNKHFRWIPNSVIYDRVGNKVGNVDEVQIDSEKYNI